MIEIVAHPQAPHQTAAGEALAEGMKRHGQEVRLVDRAHHVQADTVVCWGWRNGRQIEHARPNSRVLIMERGYVGDRKHWHSLGWGGLNGRARFPVIEDGGARWRQHFPDALRPVRGGGEYMLLLGQVRGDASLETAGDFRRWYARTAEAIAACSPLPLLFRPHPLEIERYGRKAAYMGLPALEGSLEVDLSAAAAAWAHSSNSLTDAALAGVPIYAFDPGAMVWPISGRGSLPALDPAARERWAHAIAWCQWTLDEMRSGAAWEALLRAKAAPVWSEEREGLRYAA